MPSQIRSERQREGTYLNGRWSERVSRRRLLRGAGFLGLGAAAGWAMACGGSKGELLTTLDGTIRIADDGTLVAGEGEPYQVRTDLADAQTGRDERRRSLVVFHHFADLQLLDEESPLRGEWQDSCPIPLSTAAFRPQETLTLQTAASLIRRANRIRRSPVTDRGVDFVLHTGSGAANAQYNELRWFIDLMDGRMLQPDTGAPGYEGVQGESPSERIPELLSLAQLPFAPEGLRYSWYTAVGNRDVLAQGNFARTEAASQIVVGNEKIVDLSPEQKEEVCADPSTLLDPGVTQSILTDPETDLRAVGPDPDRRLVDKSEWMQELFNSGETPGPPGHGLTQANLDGGLAYYVLEHGPLSYIVLDTVNPGGFATGSIDAAQFAWLEEQMAARSRRYFDSEGKVVEGEATDKLIVVVSHHPLERLNNPLPDASEETRVLGPEFEALLHRFPNVVAHMAGDTLANKITPRPDPERRGGSYWEITTTSPIAYPMQGRLLEVVDNADGTVSLFSTVYDLDAPIDPRSAADLTGDDGVNEAQLASAGRAIAARDPQRSEEAPGLAASDRNAELLLASPFDLSGVETPGGHMPASAQTGGRLPARRWVRREVLRALFAPR